MSVGGGCQLCGGLAVGAGVGLAVGGRTRRGRLPIGSGGPTPIGSEQEAATAGLAACRCTRRSPRPGGWLSRRPCRWCGHVPVDRIGPASLSHEHPFPGPRALTAHRHRHPERGHVGDHRMRPAASRSSESSRSPARVAAPAATGNPSPSTMSSPPNTTNAPAANSRIARSGSRVRASPRRRSRARRRRPCRAVEPSQVPNGPSVGRERDRGQHRLVAELGEEERRADR